MPVDDLVVASHSAHQIPRLSQSLDLGLEAGDFLALPTHLIKVVDSLHMQFAVDVGCGEQLGVEVLHTLAQGFVVFLGLGKFGLEAVVLLLK